MIKVYNLVFFQDVLDLVSVVLTCVNQGQLTDEKIGLEVEKITADPDAMHHISKTS